MNKPWFRVNFNSVFPRIKKSSNWTILRSKNQISIVWIFLHSNILKTKKNLKNILYVSWHVSNLKSEIIRNTNIPTSNNIFLISGPSNYKLSYKYLEYLTAGDV